ncbi:hypothetical protein JW823_01125 [bacterium]|nr:hypothetical protein [candidate division CSSED10-310 bacterium]
MKIRNPNSLLYLMAVLMLLNGCSVRRLANHAVDDMTTALYRQRDVGLARDGSASFLLVTDGLILRNPDDPGLLLSGVQVYSAYASAFVLGTDRNRAYTLLDQALEYGFALWKTRFGWIAVNRMSIDEWESELQKLSLSDVKYLFWPANAWASWITVSPDSIVALADLPYVIAALERVLQLDEAYQDGAAHLFFGMYYAVQPATIGRDLEKSRGHFHKAMEFAGPYAMLPKLLYARYYARAAFDIELFTHVLQEIVDSPSQCPDPNLNLMNAIARERAALYLEQTEDLF